MDLPGKARYRILIRPLGNGPVDDRIQKLINVFADL
jgi:hypothetical protein